jgi:hypothetical protein
VDQVLLHPANVETSRLAFGRFGLAAMSHRDGALGWPGRVRHVVKYALSYLRQFSWLDAIVDWQPIPADALPPSSALC